MVNPADCEPSCSGEHTETGRCLRAGIGGALNQLNCTCDVFRFIYVTVKRRQKSFEEDPFGMWDSLRRAELVKMKFAPAGDVQRQSSR